MLDGFGHWLQNARVYLRAKYRKGSPGKPQYFVPKTLQKTGFQVFSCQFGETDCFDTLEVMNIRTCIDFNLKSSNRKARLRAGAGIQNGLRLILISRTDRNIDFATPSVGYRVTIENPEKEIYDIDRKSSKNQYPNPYIQGEGNLGQVGWIDYARGNPVFLLPSDVPFGHYAPLGARTNLAVQRHEHHRAKKSKDQICRENKGIYKDYDDSRCLVHLEMSFIRLFCRCDPRGYVPCNKYQIKCVKRRGRHFDIKRLRELSRKNMCPHQCEEVFYRASISTYPLDQRGKRQHELLNMILHNPSLTEAEAADIEAFNMSATVLTEINVFLKTASTTVVSDVSKYLPLDLFSQLGGMFGLFLGMCVISILQWGELAFDIFRFWRYKRAENDTKVFIEETEQVGNYFTRKR